MSEFKREKRYIVHKIGKPDWNKSCVVVEEDWPEYEIVWNMIADRVNGDPYFFDELQATIEKQAAKIAELREKASAHLAEEQQYGQQWEKTQRELKQTLTSTDSTWLAEHDAEVRRKVLDVAAGVAADVVAMYCDT